MGVSIYPLVCIDVPAALAAVAVEQLFELGAEGVEQRDATTLVKGGSRAADMEEVVTLVAAFSSGERAREVVATFGFDLNPRLEEVVGDAWRDAWKEHFAPFRISPHVVVRPPWREAPASLVDEVPATTVIELEPGRAFGTGLHASTTLVAHVLDSHSAELGGAEVLDVGCGSGILSMVALALGAARARAIDVDPDAARVTLENAERNGFVSRVVADTTDVAALGGEWPIVVANIQADVLIPHAQAIATRVAERGLLVLSGILVEQRDRVLAAYPSLVLEEAPDSGEWCALVLRRVPR